MIGLLIEVLTRKPYTGNLYVRFDEGTGAQKAPSYSTVRIHFRWIQVVVFEFLIVGDHREVSKIGFSNPRDLGFAEATTELAEISHTNSEAIEVKQRIVSAVGRCLAEGRTKLTELRDPD